VLQSWSIGLTAAMSAQSLMQYTTVAASDSSMTLFKFTSFATVRLLLKLNA